MAVVTIVAVGALVLTAATGAAPPGSSFCNVRRLSASESSDDEMAAALASATEPVLIESGADMWACATLEACVARHAQTRLGVATGTRVGAVGAELALGTSWVLDSSAELGVREAVTEQETKNQTGTAVTLEMPMDEYAARLRNGSLPSADTYVFHDVTETELSADFHILNRLMARVRMAADSKAESWQSKLTETPGFIETYPLNTRIAMGHADSGNSWHSHGPAMLALVEGQKRWLIMKPGVSDTVPLLQFDRPEGFSTKDWLAKAVASRAADSPWEAGAIWDCEQQAGEIIFVPDGFKHAVLNGGEYCSRTSLPATKSCHGFYCGF
jgi:hypothetical protein